MRAFLLLGGPVFQKAVAHVLQVEGGYTDNPEDPGNWTGGKVGAGELKGTKFGISAKAYPDLDIINLTREQAIEIYRRDYWDPLDVDELAWPLALMAFDTAVNSGLSRAQRWLREHPTFAGFLAHRIRFYTRLERLWPTFGRGWMNRIATVVEATILDGPSRLGAFDPVVIDDPTLADRIEVAFCRKRAVLRGRHLVSRTEQPDLPKLDLRREGQTRD